MFSPMLAQSAPATDATIQRLTGTHYFDLKIDGVRGILAINKAVVTLTNRNGVDITYRYPEIIQGAKDKWGPDQTLVLDGEVVVFDAGGLPSFKLTAKRDRQQKPAVIAALSVSSPATFVAFDLLYVGGGSTPGQDIRNEPWTYRNECLQAVLAVPVYGSLPGALLDDRIQPNVGSEDGEVMLNFVREHKLEGLVAKKMNSRYESGRRSQWVKIKPTTTGSFLVTDYKAGNGARSDTFGALYLAVVREDGTLREVGKVGSGLKQVDLDAIHAIRNSGNDLIVEVEYQEFTVDGALRFPVYRDTRTDLVRADCTEAQLI